MNRTSLSIATLIAFMATSSTALSAVIMTASTIAPVPTAFDQFNLLEDATVPGGSAPGGGTYNSQAFSDNGGPPGQTFTTLGSFSVALPAYNLTAVSLKGANTGGANIGGFNAATTWGVRISEVNGTTLTPVKTVTGIPSTVGMLGNEWFTWTFSGADIPLLQRSKLYAFDVFSSGGYLGFDATQDDTNYLTGTAFNSAGPVRSFTDTTTGNLANHGYDRTFLVALEPAAVPEPATALLVICGLAALQATRRRS